PPRRWAALALLGVATLLPLVVRDAFALDSLILILMWGALSAAWNVAGGYAGQVSLGHAAFFGIGAYSTALMTARFQQSPWLGLLLGVALSIVAGGVIGYLSNRLRGPYFALSTIAFSQVLLILASRWRGFTAGSEGIPVPFRPGFWTLGLGHVGFVDPFYVFSIDLSIRFALNTIIGGMGTALGPFVGSILITSLETYLRATFSGLKTGFAGTYLVIYGTALILVVRFAPEGLTGLADRLGAWRARADA